TLPAVELPAEGYFVICANAATTPNCDLDVSPDTNLIQNGAPDAVALLFGAAIVDTVSYEGDTAPPYTEGSGVGLEDDPTVELAGISRLPDGVDTDQNNVDFSLRCITPGLPNASDSAGCTAAGPPQLVVNEVDYDQPGTDGAEFVEIVNTGAAAVSLAGVELRLVNGNGGGAVVYQTIELPAVELAAGGFFVVCGNAANTANCDLDVSPDTNLVQNGGPDAVALAFGGEILDTVSYEGDTGAPYTEGSGSGLEDAGSAQLLGLSRLPDGADTDQNNVDLSLRCITPGEPNSSDTTNCVTGPPQELEIWQVQGPGLASPFVGTPAITRDNVVTAVGPDGFFIQTPEARTDGDPETSDGIFVFTGSAAGVAVGDLVDVSGAVQEFFDLTELSGNVEVTVTGSGAPLPAVVLFDATTPSPDQPQPANEVERYEGMRVIFDGVATAPSDRFGDVAVVAKAERAFREPGILFPGLDGLPVWDGNPEIFEVDPDALGLDDFDLFAGQPVAAEGPLSFAFGDYQVWPTSFAPGPAPTLPRPVRERAAGELTIATQNIERFFDDQDDPETDDPVLTTEEYQARLGKVSGWVRQVLRAPDVLVVQEVENLGILEDLADRMAADDSTLAYSAWLLEGNDIGGIDVGMLTRDDTISVQSVEQFGADTIFDFDGSLLNDRPPLVLRAMYVGDGALFEFTLIGVHQRSLSGIEGSDATRVRLKRFRQAEQLSLFVQDLQTDEPERPLLVAGDFNAFQFTDGYVDVLGQVTGNLDPLGDEAETYDAVDPDLRNEVLTLSAEERYSFNFDGSAQVLDHILTSTAAQARVVDAAYARGDADAPESLLTDYTSPLRISDHDGLVLFLTSTPDEDGDGVVDQDDVCPATTIPEPVPTAQLKPLRYALVDEDTTFDSLAPAAGAREPLTITTADTAGCSCDQIILALGLGNAHRRFGCSEEAMLFWIDQVGP
ncbi:MAG: lamin tail domain-containing protein, partial [Thermoanaerobaculia bacterium]